MEPQSYPDYDNLSAEAKAFLDRQLDEFEFSARTRNCLTRGE